MNPLVERLYLPGTREARRRFFDEVGDPLVGGSVGPLELELFLVQFSARGVMMTEPVEGWIRRAGERCEALGWRRLGRALGMHAAHEANHHLMMIEDTKVLVERWNRRHHSPLDVSLLLSSAATPGIEAYVQLHEDVIASPTPFCQLAVEYEIEGLSVSLGPKLMRQCERLLGADVAAGLSFLREHIAVDAGHTRFNEAELERLLAGDPGVAEPLCRAGSAALSAYAGFLSECLASARERCRQLVLPIAEIPVPGARAT